MTREQRSLSEPRSIRAGHLLCLFCRAGRGEPLALPQGGAVEALREAVSRDPAVRLTLTAGRGGEDAAGDDSLWRRFRDLQLLRFLRMAPDQGKPASDLIEEIGQIIHSIEGFCAGCSGQPGWEGCPYAAEGHFDPAAVKTILPVRTEADKAAAKLASAARIREAGELPIRPHHLLCLCCFYGSGVLAGSLAPIAEDNLYEAIEAMRRRPDIPVRLVDGCCCVCPPCSRYRPEDNRCLGAGMAVRDEHKDLAVLKALGLRFGDALPAWELWRRLFATATTVASVCAFEAHPDGRPATYEWRVCRSAAAAEKHYAVSRRDGLGIPGASVPDA